TQLALLKALTPLFNMTAIRPVVNSKTCTNVSIIFTIYGILGVVCSLTSLSLFQWWPNEFVTWDAGQCGSDRISLPREKFWVPDIVINEFMDENTAPSVPYVFLFNTGMVHDAHPVRIISSCNLDIYTFPFDIQNCTLTFNSYLHYGIESSCVTDNLGSPLICVIFWLQIRLKRRATMYVVNLLIPSCFLITVDLFSFLLPPQSVDRSSFKMTLILGYTVFLLIMNDLLPVTGNAIPLINVFFSLCLALMVASLLETIVITNLLSGAADFGPVPNWIRVLLLQILGPLVYLFLISPFYYFKIEMKTQVGKNENIKAPTEVGSPVDEGKAVQELRSLGKDVQSIRLLVEKQLKQNDSEEEWIQVGFIIDRLLFGLYILFITVSFITIIVIWVNSYG
uniref:Uncharacterized protein n=1 Tax=Salarias fasciatus TaxID=181472 RepID=A0A672J4D3_SALFA